MTIEKTIENFIFLKPLWKLYALILAVIIFRTGVWLYPVVNLPIDIAQNPFTNSLPENAHYLYWTWLSPFLAYLVGATSKFSFLILHFFFLSLFWIFCFNGLHKNLTAESQRKSIVLFALLPVSATGLYWIGPDDLTLLLLILGLIFEKKIVILSILGIALGMQHFEQGIVAISVLTFCVYFTRENNEIKIKNCILWLLSICIGKMILFLIFKHFSISVSGDRLKWLLSNWSIIVSSFFYNIHAVVFSFFGIGWMIALKFIEFFGKKSVPLFFSILLLSFFIIMALDETRVFSIISFPLVYVFWLTNENFVSRLQNSFIANLFALWIITPWSWTWVGLQKWSMFPYDIAFILHHLFEFFNIPSDPTIWGLEPIWPGR